MSDLPFKPGFVEFAPAQNAYYYPDRPTRVIREFDTASTGDDRWEYAEQSRWLIGELAEYGIDFAPIDFVVAGRPGEFIAVVKFIEGTTVNNNFDNLNPAQIVVARNLLQTLYDYLKVKIISGEAFLGDIYSFCQYIFTPDGRAVLVDLAPSIKEARSDYFDRVDSEVLRVDFLLREAGQFYKDDKDRYQDWQQKGLELLGLIEHHNGLSLLPTAKMAMITSFMEDGDVDEAEEILYDQIALPINEPYREARRSILEKRREKLNKSHETQGS